jgi:hypothetical protein
MTVRWPRTIPLVTALAIVCAAKEGFLPLSRSVFINPIHLNVKPSIRTSEGVPLTPRPFNEKIDLLACLTPLVAVQLHGYDLGILLFDSHIERIRVGLHNRELARVRMQWVENVIACLRHNRARHS